MDTRKKVHEWQLKGNGKTSKGNYYDFTLGIECLDIIIKGVPDEDVDSIREMERERQYERVQRSIETCGNV